MVYGTGLLLVPLMKAYDFLLRKAIIIRPGNVHFAH